MFEGSLSIYRNSFYPWVAGAIGGENQRRDVWNNTMGVPAIHGWQNSPMECNSCAEPSWTCFYCAKVSLDGMHSRRLYGLI